MTTEIDPDRAVLQDKFTAIVDYFLATNPDWERADIAGQFPSRARLRKGHVQLDLELHMGKGGNGNLTYSYTTPHITGSRVLNRSSVLQLKPKVEAIVAKLVTGYAASLFHIDTALRIFERDVKNCQPESETLHKVWELLGGDKPTYSHFKREYTAGPDIFIGRKGRNLMEMRLNDLANHQVLAIAKALNTEPPPITFPHPSETLKVDDLGFVYCIDTMIGATLEYPDDMRLYTIKWQLDGEDWTATANVDGKEKYLLNSPGVTFPSDDAFAEAAANLERHLEIRIGGKTAKE